MGLRAKPAPRVYHCSQGSASFTAQPQAPAPSHVASQSLWLYEIAWSASCCALNDDGECAWQGK